MKSCIGSLIGLVLSISVGAEPLLEGRVRLAAGEPAAGAQVRLFDLTDLRQGAIARTMTDGTGYFALPLAALGRALPARFALGPNYPNPFNPSTIIPYQLAASSKVRLEVFNLLGQRIATLVDGERPAGFHTATWHAADGAGRAVGAGVYIYRMTVGMERQTGRMVLLDGQAGVAASGVAFVTPGVSGVGGSDGQVYGLVVSGSGLVPYMDSAFRVEAGMVPVELVVSSGHSAGKATDDDCALCDLFGAFNPQEEEEEDGSEEEEETDSTSIEGGPDLIVQSPSVNDSILTPGQEFILHATVHNQGDEQAAATMLRYYRSNNATITASDTEVGTDEIGVLDASASSAESIALTAPTGGGSKVYFYGACVASVRGESNTDNNCSLAVEITVSEQETLEEELPDSQRFNVELVFLEEYPEWEESVIREAVEHWEKQLMDVPSYTVPHDMQLSTCRHDSPDAFLKKGEVIDDIRVYVSLGPRDEHNSWGGVRVERDNGIPAVGCIDLILPRWGIESGMWDFTQNMGQIEGDWHRYETSSLALHEIAHALGIGNGTNWAGLVQEGEDYLYFDGANAVAAYDALPRIIRVDYHPDNMEGWGNISLNLFGYDEAVTIQPGGILYKNDKVPLNVWYDRDGNAHYDAAHWGPTLELELMGNGFVKVPFVPWTFSYKLSSVTVGALEDMGYPIRPGLADPFWVMVDEQGRQLIDRQTGEVIEYAAKPTADAAAPSPSWRCGVTGGM